MLDMAEDMGFALYSAFLVLSYAFTRFVTERTDFHLRAKGFWIHHWIIAGVAMVVFITLQIEDPLIWGIVTGIALEGLSRKKWSLIDEENR